MSNVDLLNPALLRHSLVDPDDSTRLRNSLVTPSYSGGVPNDGDIRDGLLDESGNLKSSLVASNGLLRSSLYRPGLNPLKESLLNWYDLDSASSPFNDQHGSDNLTKSGTILTNASGGPNGQNVAEWIGAALGVFKTTSYSGPDYFNEFSVEAFVFNDNFDGASGNYIVNHRGGSAGSDYYHLIVSSAGLPSFSLYDDSGDTVVVQGSALSLSAWYHLAGTHDGETLRLFVNGVEVDSKLTSSLGDMSSSSSELGIGNIPYASWAPTAHDGRIANVGIYSRAITKSEALVHYNDGAGLSYSELG